jgi:hypothetical protein
LWAALGKFRSAKASILQEKGNAGGIIPDEGPFSTMFYLSLQVFTMLDKMSTYKVLQTHIFVKEYLQSNTKTELIVLKPFGLGVF